jgi:urease accessory protein
LRNKEKSRTAGVIGRRAVLRSCRVIRDLEPYMQDNLIAGSSKHCDISSTFNCHFPWAHSNINRAMPSPFPATSSNPGHGSIHLTLLPPAVPTFSALTYTYPLKLLPSTPHILPPTTHASTEDVLPPRPSTVPLLFLLTYGGGLISGDHISLIITLDRSTRLTTTTQGSTKVFKPPSPNGAPTTRQDLTVHIAPHAALWLAPDPVQPFAESLYAQTQIFEVEREGSVGIVDWVVEGRRARGERWACRGWRGRNEVWDMFTGGDEGKRRRMLVRDAVILEGKDIRGRMDGKGVFGTVILRGPLFKGLAEFFVEEFKALPRIGGRNWGSGNEVVVKLTAREEWRKRRLEREKMDGVLWTACHVRGCAIVKFAATEVEGARAWLGNMVIEEGSIGREFGEGGLMFVR